MRRSPIPAFLHHPLVVLLLVLPLAILSGSHAHAANLRKTFPELGERRASLDSMALVVDAIEIEDIFGTVEAVLIEASRGYAEQALRLFGTELAQKRYPLRHSGVLTLGALVDPVRPFRCPDKTIPAHTDASGFHVAAAADTSLRFAPFFVDSSVLRDPEAVASWRRALIAAGTRVKGPSDTVVVVPAAVELGARLGCDALVIVSLQSYSVGTGKWLAKVAAGVALSAASGSVVGVPQFIGATIRLAIFDARDGRLIWADERTTKTLSRESLKFLAPDMVGSLP